MSEEENVKKFIKRTVILEKCSIYKLKHLLSRKFEVPLISSDITFVEEEYAEIVIRLWQEESKDLIDSKINILRKNRNDLKEFIEKVTENDFDSFHKLIKTRYGQLIENDRNIFEGELLRKACNDLVFFIKSKIEQIRSDAGEAYKFVKAFIDVLRNSNFEYKKIMKKLKLYEYCDHKINIDDVIKLITKFYFEAEPYDKLKRLAIDLNKNPLQIQEDVIRFEILPFISPIDAKYYRSSSGTTLKLIGKIIFFHDCLQMIEPEVVEVQIICDILHVSKNSQNMAFYHLNVDNLIVIANTVKVYDEITIDLSGKNAIAQNEKWQGVNGVDGTAGESGGNIAVVCDKIFHSDRMTLVSNGGNATDGINGKDGVDGEDGKDVNEENMSWNGTEFRIKTAQGFKENAMRVDCLPKELTIDTKDGLQKISVVRGKHLFYSEMVQTLLRGFLLVKGTDGTPGTKGGLGGLGGDGGFEGQIDLEISQPNAIRFFNDPGLDGKDGKPGFDGIHGKDGRDAWSFDTQFSANPDHKGLNLYNKYKIEECSSSEDLGVWSDTASAYKTVVVDKAIKSKNNTRCRNESKATRSKAQHAKAKRKKATYNPRLKSKYSEYLKYNLDRIRNHASMFDGINFNVEEIEQTHKVKIKTTCERPTIERHYVKSEFESIEFLSFNDMKRKIEGTKFDKFVNVLRKCNLSAEEVLEIKNVLKKVAKVSNQTGEFFTRCYLSNDPDIDDILSLWDDKICLTMLEDYFSQLPKKKLKIFQNKRKKELSRPTSADELIPYLFDKGLLKSEHKVNPIYSDNSDYAVIHHYFNTNGKVNREHIKDFYLEVRKDLIESYSKGWFKSVTSKIGEKVGKGEDTEKLSKYEKLIMAIIEIFFKNKDELIEISKELHELYDEINERKDQNESSKGFLKSFFTKKDEPPVSSKSLDASKPLQDSNEESNLASHNEENDAAIKTSKFIKKFLENEKIFKFTENIIMNVGVKLSIYRKILSFLFEVNIKLFVKDLSGSITLCEENYASEFYPKTDNSTNVPTFNIIWRNEKFSELEFDENSFLKDQERKFLTNELKKELENYKPKEKLSSLEFPLKKFFDSKFLHGDFKQQILSHFKDDKNYYPEVESILDDLTILAPTILKSISLRSYYEQTLMSLREFYTILQSTLEQITKNKFMIDFLTVKFLTTHHSSWIKEIIMIQIQDYLNIFDTNEMREHLNHVNHRDTLVLFLAKIETLNPNEMSLKDFREVSHNMQYFTPQTYEQLSVEEKLSSWKFITTSAYWLKTYKFLTENEILIVNDLQSKYGTKSLETLLKTLNAKENLLGLKIKKFLENFHSGEWVFSEELFKILEQNRPFEWIQKINEIYSAEGGQRSIDQVIRLVSEGSQTSSNSSNTSATIKNSMNEIGKRAKEIIRSKFYNSSIKEIEKLAWKKYLIDDQIAMILRVFRLKMGFDLRYTQIVSLLTLWYNEKDVLLQIGTGEGKTFIAVAFAVLKVLNGEKIHIVSSSKVLAERDAVSEENLKIFKVFGIKVGHNCNEDSDERRRVYQECDVVYGTLGNFQRDYLFTKFFNQNLLPRDQLTNVLIDEVDSILLDKGNNILYLSQELPGVEELNSIFIFLWQFVNKSTKTVEEKIVLLDPKNIRDAFLDNLYGVIDEMDIDEIIGEDCMTSGSKVLEALKKIEIINGECCLLVENVQVNLIKVERALNEIDVPLIVATKIYDYITRKLNSPKLVKFPKFYTKFVMHHLDKWIESALAALMMEDGREYVIDKVRDGSAIKNDPNIVIMDVDTGTDQKNSEWDEGLCQFLQLKHGCRVSLMSLKSVFISNVTYFSYYKKKYGITGTLGSKSECEKIENFYSLQFATIPTYLPKKFIEQEAIIASSNDEWLSKIVDEVKSIFAQGRSALVICNTIKEIQIIQSEFQNDPDQSFNEKNTRVYQRDYEEFDLGLLEPRQLIIASNLAGRGTDIKLSQTLANNKGLHVIMTYLASNIRIENQAFGRAARAGANGSGRLIIMRSMNSSDVNLMKEERNKQEFSRLESVSTFYENFIQNEESLFAKFSEEFTKYEKEIEEHYKDFSNVDELKLILGDNLKVLWSLWLDLNSKQIANWKENEKTVREQLDNFLEETKGKIDYKTTKLHPIMRIRVCKYLEKGYNENITTIKRSVGSVRKYADAKDLCDSEEFVDSIAYDHLKAYFALKGSTETLSNSVIRELRSLLKKFSLYETELSSQSSIISSLKEKYRRTLIPVQGFENQIKELIDTHKNFTENISKILGTGVTPDTFDCAPFGNQIFNEEFYEFLLKNNYISKVSVDKIFNEVDVNEIAKIYFLDPDSLCNILEIWRGKEIQSMEGTANFLKQNLRFASREVFWKGGSSICDH